MRTDLKQEDHIQNSDELKLIKSTQWPKSKVTVAVYTYFFLPSPLPFFHIPNIVLEIVFHNKILHYHIL